MGLRIEPLPAAKLKLSGDVDVVLDLPVRAAREGLTLAFSDGWLLRGWYDFGAQSCSFEVATEGVGEVVRRYEDAREILKITAPISWISVAAGDDTISANEVASDASAAQLALAIDT